MQELEWDDQSLLSLECPQAVRGSSSQMVMNTGQAT